MLDGTHQVTSNGASHHSVSFDSWSNLLVTVNRSSASLYINKNYIASTLVKNAFNTGGGIVVKNGNNNTINLKNLQRVKVKNITGKSERLK